MTGPILLEDLVDIVEWRSWPGKVVNGVYVPQPPVPPLADWIDPEPMTDDDIRRNLDSFFGL